MNQPTALQAGRIDVNDNDCEGITRHELALLITFDSREQLQQALHEKRVEFALRGQDAPS